MLKQQCRHYESTQRELVSMREIEATKERELRELTELVLSRTEDFKHLEEEDRVKATIEKIENDKFSKEIKKSDMKESDLAKLLEDFNKEFGSSKK